MDRIAEQFLINCHMLKISYLSIGCLIFHVYNLRVYFKNTEVVAVTLPMNNLQNSARKRTEKN